MGYINNEKFNSEVTLKLKAKGITKKDFAEKYLLITRDSLHKKIIGKRPLSKLEAKIILDVLEINVENF